MSWVSAGTSIGSPLLPAASCPEGPWLAYFALEIEQEELEDKTGLWKEVQKELASMTGKPSVDSAIKVRTFEFIQKTCMMPIFCS